MNRHEADLLALRNPGAIGLARLSHVLTPEQVQQAVRVLDGVKFARVYTLAEILGETEGAACKSIETACAHPRDALK